MDPSLFYAYEDFEQQTVSIPVWDARPVHYPATCRFDKVCLELIETLKPMHAIGGNALEFKNPKFPHVQALLNPQHHASSFPLTSSIVQVGWAVCFGSWKSLNVSECDICDDGRKSAWASELSLWSYLCAINLPQIAIMYVLCCMIRVSWVNSPKLLCWL